MENRQCRYDFGLSVLGASCAVCGKWILNRGCILCEDRLCDEHFEEHVCPRVPTQPQPNPSIEAKLKYLPFELRGKPVLVRKDHGYLTDNSILKADAPGLAFRFSKEVEDKDQNDSAEWGTIVSGSEEHSDDGVKWLKVEFFNVVDTAELDRFAREDQETDKQGREFDAKLQTNTNMSENARELEEGNTDLESRVSSLGADNASIPILEQPWEELQRTVADLTTRVFLFETQASKEQDARAKIMEHARKLEEENTHLKSRVSSLEADNASISSLEQRREELEQTNADLIMRIEKDSAGISSLEQRRQELEQTNVELMMRIQALETQASTAERDAYDAVQDNARMMDIAQHLQEDNDNFRSRVSSLEASISSSEQLRQELERDNQNLIMRIQTLEAQSNHEQDAYTQMRQIANQLQTENADLKHKVSSLEESDASISSSEQCRQELEQINADLIMRIHALETQASVAYDAEQLRQKLEQTNAKLIMRIESLEKQEQTNADPMMRTQASETQTSIENIIRPEKHRQELEHINADRMMRIQALETQASIEHEAYKQMQLKVAGLEHDMQEALEQAQQAHAEQELLFQRNRKLQEQVRLLYREQGIFIDEAIQDKTQLYADSSITSFHMISDQGTGSTESGSSSLAGDVTPPSRGTNDGKASSMVSPRLALTPAAKISNLVSPSRLASPRSNVVSPARLAFVASPRSNVVSPARLASPRSNVVSPARVASSSDPTLVSSKKLIGQTPLASNAMSPEIGPRSLDAWPRLVSDSS